MLKGEDEKARWYTGDSECLWQIGGVKYNKAD